MGSPASEAGRYDNDMQLFQARGHVVILNEMVHDARIITARRPPAPAGECAAVDGRLARALGRRHPQVVETTNLNEFTGSFDPSAMQAIGTGLTVTLTERFTRVD